MREIRKSGSMRGEVKPACGTLPYSTASDFGQRNLVSRNCWLHGFSFKTGLWHQRNCSSTVWAFGKKQQLATTMKATCFIMRALRCYLSGRANT